MAESGTPSKTKPRHAAKQKKRASPRLVVRWASLAIITSSLFQWTSRKTIQGLVFRDTIEIIGTGDDYLHLSGIRRRGPLRKRKWDRMLFGIFSYDSPNERDIRQGNRETHLSYFKKNPTMVHPDQVDTICSLYDLLRNESLADDPSSCRIVYTFVMGGGVGDADMTKQVTMLEKGRDTIFDVKTRCLWEDPDCGGTDIRRWTLPKPECNISDALADELETHRDITLLSIPENHELGKTDTWFTYAAMLTRQRPDLQIGFVGKWDSDTVTNYPALFNFLEHHRNLLASNPYVYAGYQIYREICSQPSWGRVCADPAFIAPAFSAGAMSYLSTPLVQHVFLNGTSLARKRQVWIVGEDLQLGNMAFSDPNISVQLITQRNQNINRHCSNDASKCRDEYKNILWDVKHRFQHVRSSSRL